MRFVLTLSVWVVIITLVSVLFTSRGAVSITNEIKETTENKLPVTIEITPTFAVEKDPFALDIGGAKGAFEVLLDGRTILSKTEGIHDREPVVTDSYMLETGSHEIFIKANPSSSEKSNAVRIRVLAAGNPLTDNTYWFDPGQTVNASEIFSLENKGGSHE